MKAVLDTNVWLDWLVFDDPAVAPLRVAARDGRLELVASRRMRDELADVLARPTVARQACAARARRGLAPVDAATALAAFDATVSRVEPALVCELRCSDPDDQPFLDLAVSVGARLLVTKDRALLKLARGALARHRLAILPPMRLGEAADL